MATAKPLTPGVIGWVDLTVPNAGQIRDFYAEVTGWTPDPVSMGDYEDYNMCLPDGTPAAGVVNQRGVNADIPPVWMIYIVVENLEESLARCTSLGGQVLGKPRYSGRGGGFAMIQDPAGVVSALYQAEPD